MNRPTLCSHLSEVRSRGQRSQQAKSESDTVLKVKLRHGDARIGSARGSGLALCPPWLPRAYQKPKAAPAATDTT